MPTYEYECLNCGVKFEFYQSITAEPLKECPECNGLLKRLIGIGGGIIFRGEGFYETEYKRPKSKPETKCDTADKKECSSCPNNPDANKS